MLTSDHGQEEKTFLLPLCRHWRSLVAFGQPSLCCVDRSCSTGRACPDPDSGSPGLSFPVPQTSAVLVLLHRHTCMDVGSAGVGGGVRIVEFWKRPILPAFRKALKIVSLKLIQLEVGVAEPGTSLHHQLVGLKQLQFEQCL